MHCACGFDQFVDRVRRSVVHDAPRWFVVARGVSTIGLGCTPLGTAGVGDAALWGRANVNVYQGQVQKRCKSCARLRAEKPIGGGAVVAGWVAGSTVLLLMSDIVDAACAFVQFRGQGSAIESPVVIVEEDLPEDVIEAVETTTQLPLGAVVARYVYRAAIPSTLSGEYRVLLLDRCLNVTTPVMTIIREAV